MQVLAPRGDLPVVEAMRYAVSGGKRLRAFLVLEGARLHGVAVADALWAASAIEAVHAYSLVHDDLPAMDDDDLRRGLPTVHRKWDEATAILAGDALQTLAFEMLTSSDLSPARQVALVHSLALASGDRGMVRGQALDMLAEGRALSLTEVTDLQAGKTGALIRWSAQAGPIMADADADILDTYADALGLAFQIADDLLDVEGDAETVGKAVGKDAERGKATFVSLLGVEGARRRAQELVDKACAALSPYGGEAESLRQAARFVISRQT